MKTIKKIININLVLAILLLSFSCNDLTEINENPNGVDPNTVDPNLLISSVMSGLAKDLTGKGFAGTTGVSVQYTQKDSWSDNLYDWEGSGWGTYYSLLRSNNLANERAVEMGLEFHEGVTLVLKSMLFGTLTDFYGDVPYSEALEGGDVDDPNLFPKYDSQESIYKGIIADLKTASTLLSKSAGDYDGINPTQDIFFRGDPSKWQKLANSLQLRYYMRLSEKLPAYAADGVSSILGQPLMTSVDDECELAYIGTSDPDSWPNTGELGTESSYWRIKPCATLRDKLVALDDPRAHEWFEPVRVPIQVVPVTPNNVDDETVDGIRYLKASTMPDENRKIYNPATYSEDVLDGWVIVDTSSVYVGLPVAVAERGVFEYNLNPVPELGGDNIHVSRMHYDFNAKAGEKLKSRIFSAAEVHFLMAEAALRGWGSNPQAHYEMGIQSSFDTWGISGSFSDYMDNPGVAYNGTLEQIIEQKWIANFVNGNESYFDWRRLGLPALDAGPFAREEVIPVRFMYDITDASINQDNYNQALNSLEQTEYGTIDGTDSTWSKNWLQQGVTEPW